MAALGGCAGVGRGGCGVVDVGCLCHCGVGFWCESCRRVSQSMPSVAGTLVLRCRGCGVALAVPRPSGTCVGLGSRALVFVGHHRGRWESSALAQGYPGRCQVPGLGQAMGSVARRDQVGSASPSPRAWGRRVPASPQGWGRFPAAGAWSHRKHCHQLTARRVPVPPKPPAGGLGAGATHAPGDSGQRMAAGCGVGVFVAARGLCPVGAGVWVAAGAAPGASGCAGWVSGASVTAGVGRMCHREREVLVTARL